MSGLVRRVLRHPCQLEGTTILFQFGGCAPYKTWAKIPGDFMIPLEDFFNDVLGKAQRGLGLSDDELARRAEVEVTDVQAALKGTVDLAILEKLAGALDLHGPSLIQLAQGSWTPPPIQLSGLVQFNTVFDDMTVNAYLVWDLSSRRAAAFDTGANAESMIEFVRDHQLKLESIFITHTHADHIAALDELREGTGCRHVLSHALEPVANSELFEISSSTHWQIDGLEIEPRATHGHAPAGVTYLVRGLAHPLAIVGDAVFAGSMGGGKVSYTDALATNRRAIFSLPDDTILCPGHGPLTTVGEEKRNNPFFPELK
jgi:hydroxyacylglutathione hydrolase